jgi:hypothetical protein
MATTTIALADTPIKLIVNGDEIYSDVPPQIIDGRAMVPLRVIADALSAKVEWDEYNNAIYITTQSPQTQSTAPINTGLELVGPPQVVSIPPGWFIIGYVKNNSNYTYSFVNVGINLMDDNNAVVSKIYARIKNLQPGDVGRFASNPILDERITQWQITDISGG